MAFSRSASAVATAAAAAPAAGRRRAPLLLATLAAAALPVRVGAEGEVFSVRCSAPSASACSLLPGTHATADATGSFQDDIEATGWGRLLVRTPSSTSNSSAFAAGYLEGALTAARIAQHRANSFVGQGLDTLSPGVQDFIEATDAWARSKIAAADPNDPYWGAVRFVYGQLDGLLAGVNDHLPANQKRFTRMDILTLNMLWDLGDVKQAVNVTERVDLEKMSTEAVILWVQKRSHCSSVVKLTPDGSDIFAGHNTWMGFHMMLRVFKRYEFGSAPAVAMSSYPGVLSSMDDFYQVGDLVVMETTLPNYNYDLLAAIKPQTLPFWIRAMVANRLAHGGSEWMEVFKRHNSGTYNNMWMVVDYAKFTPNKPLPQGVLTVGEQLPDYFHYEDQTRVLAYGYWPSYNAAVYPETARLIKQDEMAQKRGDSFSYQMVARAQIFRRDQGKIASDADMQRAMRYNRFQTDPLAHGDPCSQLACRGDLASLPQQAKAFGAIDAKYTSLAHIRAGQTVVVSGPTHDDQRVFDWDSAPGLAARTPHAGQPRRFDFGWQVIGRDLSATPWEGADHRHVPVGVVTAAAAAALASAVAASAAAGLARWRRRSQDSSESYRPLGAGESKNPAEFCFSPGA